MNYKKTLFLAITIILFCIPFFWLKPGEMDLGGDSSRLYFFDPIAYLHTQTIYDITSSGIGGTSISYYAIPYVLLLALVKSIVGSPTILIGIFHGLSLSLAFVSIYLIIKELLFLSVKRKDTKIEYASILSGLFYVFTPTLILGWDKEILTHNQIFLNPLIFFLLLRFLIRNNLKYLFGALLISFVFAPNFSFVAAPPFFAFYPFAVAFLVLYVLIVLKKSLPLMKIALGIALFLLVQLFHLGPHVLSLFSGGSEINNAVFSDTAKFSRGLSYFTGVASSVKVSFSLLSLAQMTNLTIISFGFIIFPFIILLGFLWNKSKLYLLTGIFFLITFFFVTANITNIGLRLYESLFTIPGFSMFRNYFGQWVFVFTFFYTLLFGQALYIFFRKVKQTYLYALSGILILVLIINAIPFINGSLLNKIHYQSNNIKVPSDIDPEYKKVLNYIHGLPEDGKFISFPLTGPGYQILSGTTGGAYQGPSTISYLTGKNDFTGYDGIMPFGETFLTLVRHNDIEGITRLLAMLNVKYIFYNSDTGIYDDNFPKYPYDSVRDYMPKTQSTYKTFLTKLPIHKVKDFGDKYHIYEVDNYLPHLYATENPIYATDPLTPYFVLKSVKSLRSVVFTSEVTPQRDAQVILEAKYENPLLDLANNYHLHIHNPFISRRMDDSIYPFVVWKEKKYQQKTLHGDPTEHLNYSLLFLAKRVYELETYKDTPITHKQFLEPKVWEFYKWKNYNSWEANLSRFADETKQTIDWVNTSGVSESKKDTMKIAINESLNQNNSHLLTIIQDSSYSEDDKKYLLSLRDNVFNQLYDALHLKTLDVSEIPYSITISNNTFGKYTVYLKDPLGKNLDADQYSLKVNNKNLNSVNATQSALLEFAPVEITKSNNNIVVQYKPQELLHNSPWLGIGTVQEENNELSFMFNNQFGNKSGFSEKINDYTPNMQYIITFDYNTEGENYQFKLAEQQQEKNKLITNSYFDKNLNSKQWKKSQSIFTAAANATAGYVQFINNTNKEKGRLHVKNLTVFEVPNDTLILSKSPAQTQVKSVPSIQFEKINPTLYKIHVAKSVDPYFLVFSEAFNNNWKLFVDKHPSGQHAATASYFNGEIKEGSNRNTFFDSNLMQLDEKHPIADSSHTTGNGYANVWNILSNDLHNQKEYDLYLVYLPQKYLYINLVISCITVLLISLYLIFYKKRK